MRISLTLPRRREAEAAVQVIRVGETPSPRLRRKSRPREDLLVHLDLDNLELFCDENVRADSGLRGLLRLLKAVYEKAVNIGDGTQVHN